MRIIGAQPAWAKQEPYLNTKVPRVPVGWAVPRGPYPSALGIMLCLMTDSTFSISASWGKVGTEGTDPES